MSLYYWQIKLVLFCDHKFFLIMFTHKFSLWQRPSLEIFFIHNRLPSACYSSHVPYIITSQYLSVVIACNW